MSRVSVVVPTYNRGAFIGEAVDSVLSQTHDDLECIVVDGGSTDDTQEILDAFTDDRLRVVQRESPKGISSARNLGIKLASGEYVLFLDDDDRLYSHAVERLLEQLRNQPEGCAGAFAAWEIVGEGSIERSRQVPEERVKMADLSDNNVIGGPSGTLFRSEVFEEVGTFDESFPAREDIDLWFRILSVYFLLGLNEVLYERQTHADQVVKDNSRMIEGQRRLLAKHADRMTDKQLSERRRDLGLRLVQQGRTVKARREIFAALRLYPYSKRTLYYTFWLVFGRPGYRIGRFGHDVFQRIKY